MVLPRLTPSLLGKNKQRYIVDSLTLINETKCRDLINKGVYILKSNRASVQLQTIKTSVFLQQLRYLDGKQGESDDTNAGYHLLE